MNVLKHMEAVFVVALGTAAVATFAIDGPDRVPSRAPVVAEGATPTPAVPVVIVSARRMTAAEKRLSLARERLFGRA